MKEELCSSVVWVRGIVGIVRGECWEAVLVLEKAWVGGCILDLSYIAVFRAWCYFPALMTIHSPSRKIHTLSATE